MSWANWEILQIQPSPESSFESAGGAREVSPGRKAWEIGTLEREGTMFRGTTIEELINSVERAERHAREEEQQASAAPEVWMQQTEYQELIEVG